MSKSQQLIDTRNALFTTFTFWFHFLDLLIKLMKMMLLYILYCPPPALPHDGKGDFNPWPFCIYWVAALPHPSCVPIWLAQRHTTPVLPSYWLAQRQTTAQYAVTCLSVGGRGGGLAWYNIILCRMAEDTQDPCISHIDASHVEWPRTESSLLFVSFFILSKS